MEENLDNFDWDDLPIPGEENPDTVEENVVKESEEDDKEVKVEGEKKEDPLNNFDFGEDDEDEDIEENKEKEIKNSTSIFTDLYSDLKDKGIFKHVSIEEGEDLDSDRFFELQEQEIETEISNRISAWAENELDEDAKAFISFKRKGGNTEDFFKVYSKGSDVPQGDIEDENFQDKVIRYQLEQEDWDDEEIEDRLDSLTESGRKKKIAEKYYQKIKQKQEEEKQNLLEYTEKQREIARANQERYKNTLKEALSKTKEIKGITISDKEKNDIFNFITKEAYKTEDNKGITGFQKKLRDVYQDKDKMILLTKLLMTDFDFTSLENKAKSKKVKEVKSKLEQRKGSKSTNFGSSLGGRSLADLFD